EERAAKKDLGIADRGLAVAAKLGGDESIHAIARLANAKETPKDPQPLKPLATRALLDAGSELVREQALRPFEDYKKAYDQRVGKSQPPQPPKWQDLDALVRCGRRDDGEHAFTMLLTIGKDVGGQSRVFRAVTLLRWSDAAKNLRDFLLPKNAMRGEAGALLG